MSGVPPEGDIEDKSLGELVALASSNVSRLVRSELELAKLELRNAAKKAGVGATMWALAGLMLGVMVILGSMTLAYFLVWWLHIWLWAGFAIVTVMYLVLAVALGVFGFLWIRRIDKFSHTRKTAADDLAMLRGGRDEPRAEVAELEDDIPTTVTPAAKHAIDK